MHRANISIEALDTYDSGLYGQNSRGKLYELDGKTVLYYLRYKIIWACDIRTLCRNFGTTMEQISAQCLGWIQRTHPEFIVFPHHGDKWTTYDHFYVPLMKDSRNVKVELSIKNAKSLSHRSIS
jgi:hypothetical protein